MEETRKQIPINKQDAFFTALRTCISDDLGKVNKEETSYDDIMDAFRLALKGVNLVKRLKNILVNPKQRTFREPSSSIKIPNFLIYDFSLKP
ncbi:MAG TPA: hypothetical protein VNB67_06075 [Nitrososphaeraceae archaeon]|nr:hypothetical protein [Nitrososphaeraceae archaeon]